MTSLPCCSTPRQTCPRRCGNSCLTAISSDSAEHIHLDRDAFLRHYYAYVYVRIMQALGAYGFRGFYQRKTFFLQSVPYALKNLRWLLHNVELPIPLPALMDTFRNMLGSKKLHGAAPESGKLTVQDAEFFFSSRGSR